MKRLIRWIIAHHYHVLSAVLYNEYGKYISTVKHDAPPPGYVRVKGYIRRKNNV